jgi:hypothetical protein
MLQIVSGGNSDCFQSHPMRFTTAGVTGSVDRELGRPGLFFGTAMVTIRVLDSNLQPVRSLDPPPPPDSIVGAAKRFRRKIMEFCGTAKRSMEGGARFGAWCLRLPARDRYSEPRPSSWTAR